MFRFQGSAVYRSELGRVSMGEGTLQPRGGARWARQGVDKVGHAEFPPCKRLRYIRRECAIAQPRANEHTPHQTNQGTRAFRFGLLRGGPSAQLIAVWLPHSEYGSAYVRRRAVAVAPRVGSCACAPVAMFSTRSTPARLQRSLPRAAGPAHLRMLRCHGGIPASVPARRPG